MRFISYDGKECDEEILHNINYILKEQNVNTTFPVFYFELDFTKNEMLMSFQFDKLAEKIDVNSIIFIQTAGIDNYFGLPRTYVDVCREYEIDAGYNFMRSMQKNEKLCEKYRVSDGLCQISDNDKLPYILLTRKDGGENAS